MEYIIHNTIPVIVINLLTTKFFGGFSFRKTSGVQTMKTNFILHIGIFAILTTMPNIANALSSSMTHCMEPVVGQANCTCAGGSNRGEKCSLDSECPGSICSNSGGGGGITPTFCTPENCKPLTTGWGSCGSGANSYVECEATAQCVGDLCMQGKNYRCVAGAYGYIPAGTTGSDSTGTYKYTSNCYYK